METECTDSGATKAKKSIHNMDINELFTHFTEKAIDVGPITSSFDLLKEKLGLEGKYGQELYDGLKGKLTTWKAKSLWEILDKKAKLCEYSSPSNKPACLGTNVVIVGCGPVGMRLAIECSLLGCDVVIVEKREYFSRNNVLHLWPFLIDDLKRLGAKKFYGGFCAGAIDHISIRTLQSVLLKISLLVGVKIYFNVEFIKILEPEGGRGWHAEFKPANHEVNLKDFSVLVGAEGKSSRIPGFDRKELRAKLALAITANFVNNHTQEEAAVQEISGVAFIFNQKFFKDLKEDTGIDLENLVYYKDDTHYFIMTAKKDSLLEKGVLKKDYNDVNELLHPSNRNVQKLYEYAREAADWSTELPHLDFAENHKKQPDVDVFDFTSIYQAEYAAKCIRREEKDLLLCLVGDSLVQPFWPQGTGCARGFLSAMDAAWMIRGMAQKKGVLEVLAERESLFQRLTQTKSESLNKKFSAFTIDPQTRYVNLHMSVKPLNVKHLYDFDGAEPLVLEPTTPKRKEASVSSNNVSESSIKNAPPEQQSNPPSLKASASPTKSLRSINKQGEITRALYGTLEDLTKQTVSKDELVQWFREQIKDYKGIRITSDLQRSFRNGMVLCTVIHRYNPEFVPDYYSLNSTNPMENNTLAFSLADKHYGIQKLLKPSEMDRPDRLALFTYLSNFYAVFKELELPTEKPQPVDIQQTPPSKPSRKNSQGHSSHYQKILKTPPSAEMSWTTRASTTRKNFRSTKKDKKLKKEDKPITEQPNERSSSFLNRSNIKKLESSTSTPTVVNDKKKEVKATSVTTTNVGSPSRSGRSSSGSVSSGGDTANKSRSDSNLSVTSVSSTSSSKTSSSSKTGATGVTRPHKPGTGTPTRPVSTFGNPSVTSDVCFFCQKKVYLMERMSANGVFFHRNCFRCSHCNTQLNLGHFAMSKGENGETGKFFCKPHYRQLFLSNPEAINYARSQPQKKTPEPTSPSATTPPTSPLGRIDEYHVIATPPKSTPLDDKDEELSPEKSARRMTRIERFSSIFRRSRSKSKSASPDRQLPDKTESPALKETPSTESNVEVSTPKKSSPLKKEPSKKELSKKESSLPKDVPKDSSMSLEDPSVPAIVLSNEEDEITKLKQEPFRERSPPVISGHAGTTPPPGAGRGAHSILRRRRGQRCVVRALMVDDEADEIALEERQKQMERFREAQSIQREMSQIELQYEELEEIARDVEQNLRDSEETDQEEQFMKVWLNLIAERNILVRRTQELSLQMKELEMEDRQYELEKQMRDPDSAMSEEQFDILLKEYVEVVEERNTIVHQVDQDRIRELEEESAQTDMLTTVFRLEDEDYSSNKKKKKDKKRR